MNGKGPTHAEARRRQKPMTPPLRLRVKRHPKTHFLQVRYHFAKRRLTAAYSRRGPETCWVPSTLQFGVLVHAAEAGSVRRPNRTMLANAIEKLLSSARPTTCWASRWTSWRTWKVKPFCLRVSALSEPETSGSDRRNRRCSEREARRGGGRTRAHLAVEAEISALGAA